GTVPIVLWPPGFSCALAMGMIAGLQPFDAASCVLGASYVIAVVCQFLFVRAGAPRARMVLAGVLAATFFGLMPGTLQALDSILSDLPFTAVLSMTVLLASRVASQISPPWTLQICAGLATGLCFWFR